MSYVLRIISSDYAGTGKITQLCSIDASGLDSGCIGCLDGVDPYTWTSVQKHSNPWGNMNLLILNDAPDANTTTGTIYMHDSFADYVMFNPAPQGSGIYVTISKVTWSVDAAVVYPDTDISQSVIGPAGPADSSDFPVWITVRQE
jgi:hypothetical protein